MATHSSVLAWRIPRTEEPGGYSPRGGQEGDTTERLSARGGGFRHRPCSPLLRCPCPLSRDSGIPPVKAECVSWPPDSGLSQVTCLVQQSESRSVVSDSLRPHGLYPPWSSPARILEWAALPFSRDLPTRGTEPGSPAWQAESSPAEHGEVRVQQNEAQMPTCLFHVHRKQTGGCSSRASASPGVMPAGRSTRGVCTAWTGAAAREGRAPAEPATSPELL